MKNATVIIPARMASSRLPGKPLSNLLGMPMIGHCMARAWSSERVDDVFVATCDVEIRDYVTSVGGKVLMTASSHLRAATRTAEALEQAQELKGESIDVVVMYQGDEPLIQPKSISQIAETMENTSASVVNLLSHISDHDTFMDRNNVKAVVSRFNKILYLSREAIPSNWAPVDRVRSLLQTGIIAFTPSALRAFNAMETAYLEEIESIDMNRILENGGEIEAVYANYPTLGVDTEEELEKAELLLRQDPLTAEYLKRVPWN